MHFIRLLRLSAIAGVITAVGLAGCGRRGALEPPPEAGVKASKAADDGNHTDAAQGNRRIRNVVPPKDPFILDPLL